MNKKYILGALVGLMLCTSSATHGEDIGEIKDRYKDLNSQKLEVEKQLQQNSGIMDRMEQELGMLESDFESISQELKDSEEKLHKLNQEIATSKQELKVAEDKLIQKQDLLGSRLSTMYKNSSTSYIEVIFDSKDLVDMFDRMSMVKNIVSHDKDIIDDVKSQKNDIIEARELLDSKEKQGKATARVLEQKKLEASNLAKSKEAMVSRLKQNEAEYRAQIETLDAESQRAMNEIRQAEKKEQSLVAEETAKKEESSSVSSGGESQGGNYYSGTTPEVDYSNTEKGDMMIVKATAYDPSPEQNGGYGGITAMGTNLRPGVIAVDPKVIPLGTKVYIEYMDGTSLGYCVAEDTGGAIKGNRIDILFMDNADAIRFGVRDMRLYILK